MRRPRPTYANVMATAAMFVALGGTSYAAVKLAAKSVGERELKDGAVTTVKVKDGSLTAGDLAPGTLQSGGRGPRGSDGPAGPKGDTGATGPVGPSEVVAATRRGAVTVNATGNTTTPLASISLSPGSWNLDAQVKIDYMSTTAEWLDCDLSTAAGTSLIRSTSKFGEAAGAMVTNTLPLLAAARFDVATQVIFSCWHLNTIAVSPTASNMVLRATRVQSLDAR